MTSEPKSHLAGTHVLAQRAAVSPPPSVQHRMSPALGLARDFAPLAAIYALVFFFTRPFYMGDTASYAIAVLDQERGHFHGYPNNLWDFGHLLWRPLGWLAHQLVGRRLLYPSPGEELLSISAGMIAVSAAAGLVSVLIVHSLAGRFASGIVRWLISLLFLSFYAFLNYIHTGTAYVPGLMCSLVGLWLLVRSVERGSSGLFEVAACGAAFAAAVLLWVPFALTLPAALVLALLWPRLTDSSARAHLRLLFGTAAMAGLFVVAAYAAVLAHMHLYSAPEVKQWILASGHGWAQNKRLLRLASGLPRSFLFMGDDTLALKRFLHKDPYAPTSLLQLVRASLWKLFLFYAFAAGLAWTLLKSGKGRTFLIALAVAGVPVLAFAVSIFEPGSPERYLQLYPFVALALACSVATFAGWRPAHLVLAAFVVIAIVTNQVSLSRARVEARATRAAERARVLKDKVSEGGFVALVTQHDDLYDFTMTFLFHPLNRHGIFPLYEVIPIAGTDLAQWRREFARRSLTALEQGQSVWISRRLLAPRPRPEWNWTEGDDPRISWRDLPAFFIQFERDESIGGEDGFVKLAPSPQNRRLLREQAS